MNDTYRRKATADEYDTLDPSTGLCSGFNALSFGCVSSRSRIPPFGEDVEIVSVDNFCASGPYPDPGNRPDIADAAGDPNRTYFGELSAWGKAHARRIKFAQWCELVPDSSNGGKCPVEYYIAWHYRYVDSQGDVREAGGPDYATPPNFNRFSDKILGPITGPVEIDNGGQPFWTFLDGNDRLLSTRNGVLHVYPTRFEPLGWRTNRSSRRRILWVINFWWVCDITKASYR